MNLKICYRLKQNTYEYDCIIPTYLEIGLYKILIYFYPNH